MWLVRSLSFSVIFSSSDGNNLLHKSHGIFIYSHFSAVSPHVRLPIRNAIRRSKYAVEGYRDWSRAAHGQSSSYYLVDSTWATFKSSNLLVSRQRLSDDFTLMDQGFKRSYTCQCCHYIHDLIQFNSVLKTHTYGPSALSRLVDATWAMFASSNPLVSRRLLSDEFTL
ncbi:hypothetical protein F5146DRAFT_146279 [Armillaria mellea]|nr:hypothetical protein F5146DRAFT_146279 [Armillaria mellea]